ncbi:MAG: DUF551 domain-containing protein [Oscillospiraceae bacterium]
MNRLTAQIKNNPAVPAKFDLDFALSPDIDDITWESLDAIIQRLAAYEDTGLEPDKIPQWIPTSEKLPEAKQRVLAYYKNQCGKSRIEIACYIPPETILADDFLSDEAEGCDEYDEKNDCYWVKEGWFEDSWESDTNWGITPKILYWMPLSQPPKGEKP